MFAARIHSTLAALTWWGGRLIVAALLAFLCVDARKAKADEEGPSVEYRVKAVMVYNFAKYVKWPASSFSSEETPMKLCILGSNPFGNLFDEVKTKKAQNHPIEVLTLDKTASVATIRTCHIVFWRDKGLKSLVQPLEGTPVLTVSDEDSESIVRFVLKDEKVRFEIDVEKAAASALVISSQLLKLAIVKGD